MEQTGTIPSNRIYKARIFEMIFSDKKELLALYNAVNKTDYDDPLTARIYHFGIYCMYLISMLILQRTRICMGERLSTYHRLDS